MSTLKCYNLIKFQFSHVFCWSRSFFPGAGVFFAGAGGEKPRVCTALFYTSIYSINCLILIIICFDISFLSGTQIILCNPICFVAYLGASWQFFKDRIWDEEISLIHFFGQDYIDYQKKIGTGLPFIDGFKVDVKNAE